MTSVIRELEIRVKTAEHALISTGTTSVLVSTGLWAKIAKRTLTTAKTTSASPGQSVLTRAPANMNASVNLGEPVSFRNKFI